MATQTTAEREAAPPGSLYGQGLAPSGIVLPLGLARFMSYQEDSTGALYAFCIMVLAPGILLFLLAQKEFVQGLTSGATKG